MGNKKNEKIKPSRLKKRKMSKQICSKLARSKNGHFLPKNCTEDQRSHPYSYYAPTPLVMDLKEPSSSETVDIKPFIQNSWFALNATSSPVLEPDPLSLKNEGNSSSNASTTIYNSLFALNATSSPVLEPKPLPLQNENNSSSNASTTIHNSLFALNATSSPVLEPKPLPLQNENNSSSNASTTIHNSLFALNATSSPVLEPDPLSLKNEDNSSSNASTTIHNSWLALNATSSPVLEPKPPPLQNEDNSSSNAFTTDENSSSFQFFRGLHSEFLKLPPNRQRQFKRKCLDYINELLDEGDNNHQNGYSHQDNMLNLSNSVHMSEEERDVKPVVEDGCTLSCN